MYNPSFPQFQVKIYTSEKKNNNNNNKKGTLRSHPLLQRFFHVVSFLYRL